eukprot:TRINITY_DN23924_c0_g1_i1.p1 TRINITY_DN23924_c0_g1~~TRINITY_DN23924_c0_g1_i1.p1  ORF type:complete len:1084 (+),score=181.42 TRINITY_DN23924_c0_g1_i1:51-3254(+)
MTELEESSGTEDDDKESFDDKMKRITKLGKEGNMEELVKVAKLADMSPEMIAFAAGKSKEMGNAAFQKKKYEEALEHYAGALAGDCPEKHKVFSNRSACLFQLGKYTEALQEASKAIRTQRSWSKGYFRAGRAALEMDFYDEALEMFEKGLEKEPKNSDLILWAGKARDIRDQQRQDKLMKKHATDYSKFEAVVKEQATEEEMEEKFSDPNCVILGSKYYTSSKMEQRQLKAMLGYQEAPPTPFEPTFSPELIFRHDARGAKTQHPVWDPTSREWRIDAKPAPSRVDYSDSVQTQGIATFLERQSDVQYVHELLNLLDHSATPVDIYVRAMRSLVGQLVGSTGPSRPGRKSGDRRVVPDDARWLFVGVGTALPILTVSRYLPTAELIANSAHKAAYIAELAIAMLVSNGAKKDSVRFIHRPSQDLAVVDPEGEDKNNLTGRVDVVVFDFELFDPGLIGKGILTKVNHAKKKLLTAQHLTVPMGAAVACAPCEMVCPRGNGPDGLDWSTWDSCRWGAFYDMMNLDQGGVQEPWRILGPIIEAFDFDFTEAEVKTNGQADLRFTALDSGVLTCIVFWYRLALTEDVELDHTPNTLRSSGSTPVHGNYSRHAVQWLQAPLMLRKGDEVHVRASYSRARIRFEVMSPETRAKERHVACPRWMFTRMWDEQRTEAFQRAIAKAAEQLMAAREDVPKLDRTPVRLVHIGAGMGQISMLAAKCLREAGVSEADIDTHGCTVVAFEQMPKTTKLAQRSLKDNGVHKDVAFCSEDLRKLPNQPARAQILVNELIDPGLLGEGMLPFLSAARVKLCNAFDHQVIPSRATIWAAAFEFGENLTNCHGSNLSVLNHYRNAGEMQVDVDEALEYGYARQLSAAFEVLRFDFENSVMPEAHDVTINPTDSGVITAIVFWYEVDLDREGEIILTNWPEAVPPADFSMMEKDLHRPAPLKQAITHFQGSYCRKVTKNEPVNISVGYTQSWPQFIWPGTEMVQKEGGEMVPKPSPMPRHYLVFEKFMNETAELEKKLHSSFMYDEEVIGVGFAAAERIALEPNGSPDYLIDPTFANFFHLMFFL